jgi:hypothetical protein
MKANETKMVGAAEITKRVIRSSVKASKFAYAGGRRHFSETTYIVKLAGRYVAFESTLAAAEKAAKDAQ